jgi:tRNA(Arg) A34 adenosine deaminase TadA
MLSRSLLAAELKIAQPLWVLDDVDWTRTYTSTEDRMRLAIELARRNGAEKTGGPFGAVVFDSSGRVVAMGTNMVVPSGNAFLHAEIVALMFAQHALGSYSLRDPEAGNHELVASCAPCAMCLGAVLWSGVTRLVTGATREDAIGIGFDEGPVFDASYQYLAARGVEVISGILREDARAVLEEYRARGGPIYNP